jgi:hypothetical protein
MEKVSNMRELVAAVAGPRQWSDNRKSWLSRAARNAGISFRQVKAVFYGEITDENHSAVRLLQHAAGRRAEVLASRFESIARGMESADSDFYREDIAALVHTARALRGLDGPGNDQA